MLQFPLPDELDLQLEKGNNLTFNVYQKKKQPLRTTLYYLEEHHGAHSSQWADHF